MKILLMCHGLLRTIRIGHTCSLFQTIDGGMSWTLSYTSDEEGVFYDAMDFWDNMEGIAFGDAINGTLMILRTSDGGKPLYEQVQISLIRTFSHTEC